MELWHYTNLESCIGILTSQQLWFSDFLDTNDSTDGDWARHILEEYYSPLLEQALRGTPIWKRLRATGNPKKIVEKEIRNRLDIIFKRALVNKDDPMCAFKGYLFCTSLPSIQHADDGILSMWRGYGGKQPVALVFDEGSLESAILSKAKNDLGWLGNKVIYARSHRDILDEDRHFLDKLMPIMTAENPGRLTPENKINECFHGAFNLSARIKHQGFVEENEYRMVALTPNMRRTYDIPEMEASKNNLIIEPENGKDRLKVLLGSDLYPCLTKVVIGPNANQELVAERLKKLRRKLGIRLTISYSTIPFISN